MILKITSLPLFTILCVFSSDFSLLRPNTAHSSNPQLFVWPAWRRTICRCPLSRSRTKRPNRTLWNASPGIRLPISWSTRGKEIKIVILRPTWGPYPHSTFVKEEGCCVHPWNCYPNTYYTTYTVLSCAAHDYDEDGGAAAKGSFVRSYIRWWCLRFCQPPLIEAVPPPPYVCACVFRTVCGVFIYIIMLCSITFCFRPCFILISVIIFRQLGYYIFLRKSLRVATLVTFRGMFDIRLCVQNWFYRCMVTSFTHSSCQHPRSPFQKHSQHLTTYYITMDILLNIIDSFASTTTI